MLSALALRLFAFALLAAAAPSAASACSYIRAQNPSRAERVEEARDEIAMADAIIDAEVVRPFIPRRQTALVRAARVLKGPRLEWFEIGERDSCDVELTRTGERVRLILDGGPDMWFAKIEYAEPRIVDRLLGSDRRIDWPYVAGTQTPP